LDATVSLIFLSPKRLPDSALALDLTVIDAQGCLVYSLLTRYEMNVVGLIPMPVHLALDLLAGLLLIGAAFFFRNEENGVMIWYLILGLFSLGAGLLTDTTPVERTAMEQSEAHRV
jgi:hypothetical protein